MGGLGLGSSAAAGCGSDLSCLMQDEYLIGNIIQISELLQEVLILSAVCLELMAAK